MADGSVGFPDPSVAARPRGERLSSAERLRRRPDYKRVYAEGRRFPGRWLVLFSLPNGTDVSRLGVTATRRTGGATVRNAVRRRLREIYRRRVRETLPGGPAAGLDLVANVKDGAPGAPFEEFAAEFLRLCRRAAEQAALAAQAAEAARTREIPPAGQPAPVGEGAR